MTDKLEYKLTENEMKKFCDDTSLEMMKLCFDRVEKLEVSEAEGLNLVSNVMGVALAKVGWNLSGVHGIQGLSRDSSYKRLKGICKIMFDAVQHNMLAIYEQQSHDVNANSKIEVIQ